MISKMRDCGFDQIKATEIMRERKMKFDKAVIEWKEKLLNF